MVTQRTEGLYRLFLLCQIIIVAALFWSLPETKGRELEDGWSD